MKTRNNCLKCKKMKNYCTVLLKLAEKFSLAASQPKSLASFSAEHFLGSFGYVWLLAYRTPKKPLPFINCKESESTGYCVIKYKKMQK